MNGARIAFIRVRRARTGEHWHLSNLPNVVEITDTRATTSSSHAVHSRRWYSRERIALQRHSFFGLGGSLLSSLSSSFRSLQEFLPKNSSIISPELPRVFLLILTTTSFNQLRKWRFQLSFSSSQRPFKAFRLVFPMFRRQWVLDRCFRRDRVLGRSITLMAVCQI